MPGPNPFLVRASVGSLVVTVTSSLAIAHREGRGGLQPLNATSHWLNGEQAAERRVADVRYTGVGAAPHAAATFFWAVVFEAWVGPRRPRPAVPMARIAAS